MVRLIRFETRWAEKPTATHSQGRGTSRNYTSYRSCSPFLHMYVTSRSSSQNFEPHESACIRLYLCMHTSGAKHELATITCFVMYLPLAGIASKISYQVFNLSSVPMAKQA